MVITSISGKNGAQFSNALLHHRKKSILITFQGLFFVTVSPHKKLAPKRRRWWRHASVRVFWWMRKPQTPLSVQKELPRRWVANATGCSNLEQPEFWLIFKVLSCFVKVILVNYYLIYQTYQSHPCVCWYAWNALRGLAREPLLSWLSFCGDLKGCFRQRCLVAPVELGSMLRRNYVYIVVRGVL